MSFRIGENFREHAIVSDTTSVDNKVTLRLYDPLVGLTRSPRRTVVFGGQNDESPKRLLEALDKLEITQDSPTAANFAYGDFWGLIGKYIDFLPPHDIVASFALVFVFPDTWDRFVLTSHRRSEIQELKLALEKITP